MAARSTGSLRERRPGIWEIRIAVATDPVTGRTIQRSFSFHGGAAEAEAWCRELAAEYAGRRGVVQQAPFLTVAELMPVGSPVSTTGNPRPGRAIALTPAV